jgi:hypothetical protein
MPLGAALLLTMLAALVTSPAAVADETLTAAHALLSAWHEDPARIDRARALLETAAATDATGDTLTELSHVWFLTGDFRARGEAERVTAYERGTEAAKRAIALAPRNDRAHLWLAINSGRIAEIKGVGRALALVGTIREESETVLKINPANVEGLVLAGGLAAQMPVFMGGDRGKAETLFKRALEMRETALPGAVLTRVASSHIRVGTFQFFAARGDVEALRLLADHVIDRHYPDARGEAEPYRALFDRVIARQAELIAKWMLVGFIHGVMNTDNCSIAGETIDYGPCAFMDAYNPETVFSSIDHGGRYAYGQQPRIANWNLARFGETLLPLLADNTEAALAIANESLGAFQQHYAQALIGGMRRKLGLFSAEEGDGALAQDLLNAMADGEADFTLTFRRLDPELDAGVLALFKTPDAYDAWALRWRERLAREPQDAATRRASMRAANPAYTPRNHRVEAALAAAVEREDFAPFEELLNVLARPFEDRPEFAAYADPPPADQRVCQTFCGT